MLLNFKNILMFAFFLVFAESTLATTLAYKNFDSLVDEADGVIHGIVTDVESVKNKPGDINTFITISIIEVIVGSYSDPSITIRQKGGRVGYEGVSIHGSPKFSVNDEVILFIRGNGQYMVPFVGWEQGVFKVKSSSGVGKSVFDSNGNKILSFKESNLVKQNVNHSGANIIDLHAEKSGLSKITDENASLNLEEFISKVKKRASLKKSASSMKSINK